MKPMTAKSCRSRCLSFTLHSLCDQKTVHIFLQSKTLFTKDTSSWRSQLIRRLTPLVFLANQRNQLILWHLVLIPSDLFPSPRRSCVATITCAVLLTRTWDSTRIKKGSHIWRDRNNLTSDWGAADVSTLEKVWKRSPAAFRRSFNLLSVMAHWAECDITSAELNRELMGDIWLCRCAALTLRKLSRGVLNGHLARRLGTISNMVTRVTPSGVRNNARG